ncbi:hypothetical protein E2C01_029616 [Portunus trituberculatus]|uniref:Uncharacterized protein n=1 Tax=Portunus trituberculatus TaxID=210409 RepID=A0A5B7ESC7_PORTR|nr:hypothetical protein [Portunus trituberculatus]
MTFPPSAVLRGGSAALAKIISIPSLLPSFLSLSLTSSLCHSHEEESRMELTAPSLFPSFPPPATARRPIQMARCCQEASQGSGYPWRCEEARSDITGTPATSATMSLKLNTSPDFSADAAT